MIENKEQFGFYGLDVKGICIHNTGNPLSAQENYNIMANSKDNRGCHFFIDESEVIQAMPLDYCVYHSGMGIDWACRHTIAVEIARSQAEHEIYTQAEANAVEFIKTLMDEYGLTTDNIYFHNDFNNKTYCPHKILDNESKKEWIVRCFNVIRNGK